MQSQFFIQILRSDHDLRRLNRECFENLVLIRYLKDLEFVQVPFSNRCDEIPWCSLVYTEYKLVPKSCSKVGTFNLSSGCVEFWEPPSVRLKLIDRQLSFLLLNLRFSQHFGMISEEMVLISWSIQNLASFRRRLNPTGLLLKRVVQLKSLLSEVWGYKQSSWLLWLWIAEEH